MKKEKTIAFGVDVGKKELVVCGRSSDGLTDQPACFPNDIIGFKKILVYLKDKDADDNIPVLLESTGPYHWKAAHFLAEHHFSAKVVNPIYTKQMFRFSVRKRKTDKVDAAHLAFMASCGAGYLFRETEEMARKKALVRHYWKLKETSVNHLRHERYLIEYRSISSFKISPLIRKKCEALKKEIVGQFSSGNDLRYLSSIPGVSSLLGATILAEIIPLDRFKHPDQLVAYAGLDPSIKQSGSKAHHSKLSKRGSAILREALFLCAFGAFSRNPFKKVYQHHKDKGLHHTACMCILARKILKTGWALLKKREDFNEQYILKT